MILFVYGIGIWNLQNPKIQKALYSEDGAFYDNV